MPLKAEVGSLLRAAALTLLFFCNQANPIESGLADGINHRDNGPILHKLDRKSVV